MKRARLTKRDQREKEGSEGAIVRQEKERGGVNRFSQISGDQQKLHVTAGRKTGRPKCTRKRKKKSD